jgi:hypothetical protein
MSEFDNEETGISQYSRQTNGRIAPMAEHRFEEPAVQVRILLRPQRNKNTRKGMKWNRNNNGEN